MEVIKRTGRQPGTIKVQVIALFMIFMNIGTAVAAEVILTFRQEGKDFEDAFRGLKDELRGDFEVRERIIDKKCSVNEFTELIHSHQPKLVVLMDNAAIALFRKYQSTLPETATMIPSIAIMGVMIKEAIADLKNACGISYEVPIVTSVVSLRSVLGIPIKKVGVVHREFLMDFVEKNSQFCKREGIEIVNKALPDKSNAYGPLIKNALKGLDSRGIDALWVPNDNALLQANIIRRVWMPATQKYKVPVIVGVEVLVNPKLNFGTFAVLPDHVALGSQAAGMVYEIKDNNWVCEEHRVDPPLAVYKIINLLQAKKRFTVSDEKLKSIDKKLK
ncbi:MAG: hypothetical protein JW913_08425 [Chitinispirillaceae bacterium]|nr:hypothetical protein [Chitinispirillaceae bacterium]